MMKSKIIALGIIFSICHTVNASSHLSGKVTYVGTYGNGDIYINTDKTIDEPGCSFIHGQRRIDLPASHPQAKNWLAIAMAALASDRTIEFKTKGCYEGQPTADNTRNTYFLMTP